MFCSVLVVQQRWSLPARPQPDNTFRTDSAVLRELNKVGKKLIGSFGSLEK